MGATYAYTIELPPKLGTTIRGESSMFEVPRSLILPICARYVKAVEISYEISSKGLSLRVILFQHTDNNPDFSGLRLLRPPPREYPLRWLAFLIILPAGFLMYLEWNKRRKEKRDSGILV